MPLWFSSRYFNAAIAILLMGSLWFYVYCNPISIEPYHPYVPLASLITAIWGALIVGIGYKVLKIPLFSSGFALFYVMLPVVILGACLQKWVDPAFGPNSRGLPLVSAILGTLVMKSLMHHSVGEGSIDNDAF